MADTLPNVELPKGVWVDLYAETGIAAGLKIRVQNISVASNSKVNLTTKGEEPTNGDGFSLIGIYESQVNEAGDSGAWAKADLGGYVNVMEAV